jgi:predicted P-loop ATPase
MLTLRAEHPEGSPLQRHNESPDNASLELQRWLWAEHKIKIPKNDAADALQLVASECRRSPVRDYLEALPPHDGTPRLAHLMAKYFGATGNDKYMARVGRKWAVAAVARALNPGCQVDTMLILHGRQGAGKSQAIMALAGPGWSRKIHLDPNQKDTVLLIAGAWIIEVEELGGMHHATAEALKAIISRQIDSVRLPYARAPEDLKRASLFVGTTNKNEFLRDPTGERRFWPVSVGTIDLDGLRRDRDQIWAEALEAYRAKEPHWPEAEDLQLFALEAEIYADTGELSDTEDLIYSWFSAQAPEARPRYIRTAKLVESLYLISQSSTSYTPMRRRMSDALARMGFTKIRHREGSKKWAWTWKTPDDILNEKQDVTQPQHTVQLGQA